MKSVTISLLQQPADCSVDGGSPVMSAPGYDEEQEPPREPLRWIWVSELQIDVTEATKIIDVKFTIRRMCGICVHRQTLYWKNHFNLHNQRTLASYNVHHGATLRLDVAPRRPQPY